MEYFDPAESNRQRERHNRDANEMAKPIPRILVIGCVQCHLFGKIFHRRSLPKSNPFRVQLAKMRHQRPLEWPDIEDFAIERAIPDLAEALRKAPLGGELPSDTLLNA